MTEMGHDGGEIMRISIAQKERHTARRQYLHNLMQDSLSHRQAAFPHLDTQQQFRLRIDGGPDPVG